MLGYPAEEKWKYMLVEVKLDKQPDDATHIVVWIDSL